jgi:FkbM family methyltransferase
MPSKSRLIVDAGMSEGNDTDFYLRKGFSVLGVEADPTLVAQLRRRFADALAQRRLRILNRAAAATSGATVRFWHHPEQGHSALAQDGPTPPGVETFEVETIDWPTLCRSARTTPYYVKLDIEGAEPLFLASMSGSRLLPDYISAECQTARPIAQFHALGYRGFRLINQEKVTQFAIPNPPLEGDYVADPPRHHWSGLFGRELPGKTWFDYPAIMGLWQKIHELWEQETVFTGWLDCHARLGEP